MVPAPLLPPHRISEILHFFLGLNWKMAYLVAAIGLQAVFYFSIGVLSAFTVRRASDRRRRLLQILIVPIIIVIAALVIRSVKLGFMPVWVNAAIPMVACVFGVWMGLGLFYGRGFLMSLILVGVAALSLWGLSGGNDAELTHLTQRHLKRLVDSRASIPKGDARFGEMVRLAFSPLPDSGTSDAIAHNRAAIMALGITLGNGRLAKLIGVEDFKLLRSAVQLRKGTSLRGRKDWSQHFCLSAALAVLENPLVSDAGGLMKEQMDALSHGSGFSFGDIGADRAGVRFAAAATNSEEDAKAMQDFLMKGFTVDDFIPPLADLPEKLTTEQFQSQFGNLRSDAYREKINEIETRLNGCVALSPLSSRE